MSNRKSTNEAAAARVQALKSEAENLRKLNAEFGRLRIMLIERIQLVDQLVANEQASVAKP